MPAKMLRSTSWNARPIATVPTPAAVTSTAKFTPATTSALSVAATYVTTVTTLWISVRTWRSATPRVVAASQTRRTTRPTM